LFAEGDHHNTEDHANGTGAGEELEVGRSPEVSFYAIIYIMKS
jgi:hypothetical protein